MAHKLRKMYLETDVPIYDPAQNGSKESYMYDVECYDGYAIAHVQAGVTGVPKILKMKYPTLEEVMQNKELREEIYDYRRQFVFKKYIKNINYGDIMNMRGEIAEVIYQ